MKKLDDLPKMPHSMADVMKAMAELHKLVLKQSAAYGGKHSKYLPAHVVETSLMKSISSIDDLYEGDEVDRLLNIVHNQVQTLSEHLKEQDDKEGLRILGSLMKMLGAAIGASHTGK
jgi:hypothetical protein